MDSRTVLITGCSSGFGRGMVPEFLKHGWTVIATLRNGEVRSGLFARELEAHPGRLSVVSLDVTDPEERAALAETIRTRCGELDCLVNNAGYALFGALEDLSEVQIRRQMEVNFWGTVLLTRELLPFLRRARGRIINLSSVLGHCGFPLTSAYCASKFALEGFTEALSHELRPHRVQVALVEPGRHRTRFSDNVEWGDGSTRLGSAYIPQSQNYRRLKDMLASRKGAGADPVVRAVVRLASMKRMPLRRRVGWDAVLVHLVQRLLPEQLTWRLFSTVYDGMFLRDPRPRRGRSQSHVAPELRQD